MFIYLFEWCFTLNSGKLYNGGGHFGFRKLTAQSRVTIGCSQTFPCKKSSIKCAVLNGESLILQGPTSNDTGTSLETNVCRIFQIGQQRDNDEEDDDEVGVLYIILMSQWLLTLPISLSLILVCI